MWWYNQNSGRSVRSRGHDSSITIFQLDHLQVTVYITHNSYQIKHKVLYALMINQINIVKKARHLYKN